MNHTLSEKIDELVRNEQRFQTLVRITSQVIWTTNPGGRMEGAQPGWAAFTGQSFGDYQGSGWYASVHPEDAQPTIDEWNRCVADRREFLFEHRLRRHDGAYRTCTINAAPIFNGDGSMREWVGVHNDITESRQQEDEIRAKESKFRLLAESLPQIVWTATPDGVIDYYNQRWFDYIGCTQLETQGWGCGSVLHPDDLQACVRNWHDSLESGEPIDSELRLLRASDATYRWHLGRGVPLRDANGVIVKWLGSSTDIDDYKRAEATNLALQAQLEDRVQQRTAELERVGKIAGVGGWSLIVAGAALSWSDETCRIHDLQPGYLPAFDEALGYYTEASRSAIEAACRDCMANAVPFDLDLQMTTAKGRGIWVRAIGEAQIELGTVVRIFGAFQDITRDHERDRLLQEAKSEAERANALKTEFLANMSHEIRTPLSAVIGLVYLLGQTSLSGRQRSYLKKINFAGHSLLGVINDILDLSKIEAGEMLIEDRELDVKHLVQGVCQMLTPSAQAKGIALSVQCAAGLPAAVRGDATRLGQIATNLLSNAIKFTEKGEVELILSCSKPTDVGISVRLSVRDTGIGMDANGLACLFRPFSQADASTTRRFGGSGLGLSITRRLVELMGGEIGVTSTVGVGSEFCVDVPLRVADASHPLIERALAATLPTSLGARSLSGANILVVDDSEINCEVAQHILHGHGATVAITHSGAEALERLRQDPTAFEIVLMDVQMPDMDGNEVARRIRTELQLETLPIIALTAGALLSERARSLQAGMNDFLTKPFEPAALIALVGRHLKGRPVASFQPAPPSPITAGAHPDGSDLIFNASSQIDTTVARDVFGEDTALFATLLGRLLRDFSEFSLPISLELHDAPALTNLMTRLHKLAGGAGMIGATTVHRLAAAAEAALASGQAPDEVETLLQRLAAALTTLAEEVAPMLAAATVTDSVSTHKFPTSIVATPQSIGRLLELLDHQNMEVMEHFSAMSPALRSTFGEVRFAHLREAVNSLHFAVAAALLRESSAADQRLASRLGT